MELEAIQLTTGDTFMSDNKIAEEEIGEGILQWVGLIRGKIVSIVSRLLKRGRRSRSTSGTSHHCRSGEECLNE